MDLLNENSDLEWTYSNSILRLVNTGVDLREMNISSVKTRAGVPSSHASGLDNGTVYVNNYTADYNYYMGMNYTYSSNGSFPTKTDKGIYSDDDLVYVQLNYSIIKFMVQMLIIIIQVMYLVLKDIINLYIM